MTTSGTPYQTSEASDYIIPVAFARGGEFLDETATVCFRSPGGPGDPPDPPPDPPFVCQFSEYPDTVGWKSGFRALKDALLLDPEPEVPPEDDHVCDTSGAPPGNDGPDGICERVFDRNRKDMFRYVFFAHSLGVPKAHC